MAGNTFGVLPPGLGDQTVATQALVGKMSKRAPARRKKRAKKTAGKKRAAPKRRATSGRKKPARLVKGSAAAKRHMAKLRKMRRR